MWFSFSGHHPLNTYPYKMRYKIYLTRYRIIDIIEIMGSYYSQLQFGFLLYANIDN